MTCATCKHWQLKDSSGQATPMVKHQMAPCEFGPSWRFLSPHQTCSSHQAATDDVIKARDAWLNRKGRGDEYQRIRGQSEHGPT